MTSLILEQLREHVRSRPTEAAVNESGTWRSITWAELFSNACCLAEHLRAGSSAAGPVILCSGNRIEFAVAVLGVLLADATVFPVSLELTATELRHTVEASGASTLIGDAISYEKLNDRSVSWVSLDGLAPSEAMSVEPLLDVEFQATGGLLLQSSGTTGLPRIVRRDMAALDAVARNCVAALSLGTTDRMLAAIPLHHSYGLEHGIFSCVAAGATLELHQNFDPARVIAALAAGRVTHLPAVPFMLEILASHGPVRLASAVRHIYSAGACLPRNVAEAFEHSFGIRVGQIYGATEFGSVTFNDPFKNEYESTVAGQPLTGVEMRIVGRDDPQVDSPLAAGQEGQLAVRAPSMFSGYVGGSPAEVKDGWFFPGDLGRLDARGRLTVTGRLKLLIDVGGIKVNPMEVEAVLAQHPGVREAVVVPIPVTQTLARLKAIVLLRSGAATTTDELRLFVQERLSGYKVPRVFEVRPSFPRSPTGKVLRQALQCS